MLRNGVRVAGGLYGYVVHRSRSQTLQYVSQRWAAYSLFQVSKMTFSQSSPPKDYALPNSSWNKDMVNLYNKYMEMVKDGTWRKLPSYNRTLKFVIDEDMGDSKNRLFTRNTDIEGTGFEYVIFYNKPEKRVFGIFQFGHLLEGPPGHTHGGAIATAIDTIIGSCATCVAGMVMTANLSINYRNPIPLGTTVVLDCSTERIEGRKVFLTCQVRSADGAKIHTDATALFIQLTSELNVGL